MKKTRQKNATSAIKRFIGVLIVAAFLAGCTRIPSPEEIQAAQAAAARIVQGEVQGETKMTGTTEDGDVAIALTPQQFAGGILAIDIKADTHSVDLSPFDLAKIATLAADGKTYKPTSVSALSGHHASGTLRFNIKKAPEEFTIRIQGIPAQQQRIYQWGE